MNAEEEKELYKKSYHRALDENVKMAIALDKADSAANRHRSTAIALTVMVVIMFVSIVVKVIFLTPDPNAELEKTKAELDHMVEVIFQDREHYWKQIEFLEYANEFGFCDPRPMAGWMDSYDALVDKNAEHYAHILDCEDNLRKCNNEPFKYEYRCGSSRVEVKITKPNGDTDGLISTGLFVRLCDGEV